MAVFTSKADEGLSLLTQMQQINRNDIDEVIVLFYRFRRKQFAEIRSKATLSTPLKTLRKLFQESFGQSWQEVSEELFISQRFLIDAYDRKSFTTKQIEWLRISRATTFSLDILDPGTENKIPIGNIRVAEVQSPLLLTNEIKLAIHSILAAMETGATCLRKCEECRSIFVVERTDQIYCSKRCGDQVANRRKRVRDKENLQED